LHPVFLPFWLMCINNFHIFAHDGTSTAVHLFSPYHPNQRPWKCCYPLGSFVPAASHPRVAPDACAGRLLMMEHEVKSIFNIERTFNSYLSDFVSHLHLAVTVGTCCRGGFRRAFLSEGHGTAKRESAVGVPPNPPCNMYCVKASFFSRFLIFFQF
jgi:hypothetical protein